MMVIYPLGVLQKSKEIPPPKFSSQQPPSVTLPE
jgi:hypothetical protein